MSQRRASAKNPGERFKPRDITKKRARKDSKFGEQGGGEKAQVLLWIESVNDDMVFSYHSYPKPPLPQDLEARRGC